MDMTQCGVSSSSLSPASILQPLYILNLSQKHHLYFQLQAKKNMFFSSHDHTNIFLWAIAPSEYADVVTTIQTTVDAYCHPDDGVLPEHLQLNGIAMMIHATTKH